MADPGIPITVYGDVDERAVAQLRRCAEAGDAVAAALCADGHVGYSQPIGGVVAYPDHISPSGVGYDIACLAAGTPVVTHDGYHLPIELVRGEHRATCWDGRVVRTIDPLVGAVARGVREVHVLRLADDRTIVATADHRVRTKLGWRRIDELARGEAVAVTPFVGLPCEQAAGQLELPSPHEPGGRARSRTAGLADRGLWPVRIDDPRFPAMLRLLAYCVGDGHLHNDRKSICWYTSVEADAAALAGDVARAGFTAAIHARDRGGRIRRQYIVKTGSVELHALLEALGCPVGRKATACWPQRPLPWLDELPAWVRATFLSAFASAEGTTPALDASGALAPLAIKQAGRTTAVLEMVARLFASLGFATSITASGRMMADGVQTHVLQVLGGAAERRRYLCEVGFNLAVEKRVATAAALSVYCQRDALAQQRRLAIEAARALKLASGERVRDIVERISAEYAVPPALVHHGLYGRGAPRVPKGARPAVDHSNEVAWLPVESVVPGGRREVFDVVTGDGAESFLAAGVVVHNCGNKAARTDVRAAELRSDLPRVMDEVFARISFGMGRKNDEPVDHPVLDAIRVAEFEPQRELHELAAKQLGTVGAGNHYVDLFEDEEGYVWVGVHFGSRGFGHKTASGFLALAEGKRFGEHATEGEMDSPPKLLPTDGELGRGYIAAMELAGRYAYAGRDTVVAKVLEILGARSTYEVHNHHNFAWRERHFGTDVWVIRKGCTPAFPGQEGFVGATMGEPSVILRGTPSPQSEALLNSTVHGAGRVMSRTQAAGRMGQRAECSERDCDFWVTWGQYRHERARKGLGENARFTLCPQHPGETMLKRRGRVKAGRIDYGEVRREIARSGIELRGGAADEAPGAYKRLDTVLAAHGDTIEVLHRLTPIGVAMAGADTFDPYKD